MAAPQEKYIPEMRDLLIELHNLLRHEEGIWKTASCHSKTNTLLRHYTICCEGMQEAVEPITETSLGSYLWYLKDMVREGRLVDCFRTNPKNKQPDLPVRRARAIELVKLMLKRFRAGVPQFEEEYRYIESRL